MMRYLRLKTCHVKVLGYNLKIEIQEDIECGKKNTSLSIYGNI